MLIGTYGGFLQNQNIKRKRNIRPLILGARAFVRAIKKNVAFAIYVASMDTSTEKGV
jgi:hypothetical protein